MELSASVLDPGTISGYPQGSWENAAYDAVQHIVDHSFKCALDRMSKTALRTQMRHELDGLRSSVNSDTFNESAFQFGVVRIGAAAHAYLDDAVMENHELVEFLAEKQAGYGTGNIDAFGLAGIHVRVSDKIARLENLIEKERDTNNFKHVTDESVHDTVLDLVGYAVITQMWHNGTFGLPLERDMPELAGRTAGRTVERTVVTDEMVAAVVALIPEVIKAPSGDIVCRFGGRFWTARAVLEAAVECGWTPPQDPNVGRGGRP